MRPLFAIVMALLAATAVAQQPSLPLQPAGTLVLMTGAAEVELANDEAVASFFYEVQDADLLAWVTGTDPVPTAFDTPLLKKIMALRAT